MLNIAFDSSETSLMVESLYALHAIKQDAFVKSRQANLPFHEQDFGIPKIKSLLMKIDRALIEEDSGSAIPV
ncbi:hypothetical protein [Thiobacillus sp.]|uniref:hypothetical protein n=1 Tax=Thiobacillus sp. TaxID=924 RepID=UPI0017BFDB89|nr:hypothetical protein [Thiobacillus sp.]MBC2731202.1 hypothetical protein [Thiobacillus sp.]MBC2739939.1 hypothetical protein [Thiobacillus sp.]MBC2758934.1 hypothetical protein [Thiobacillus sp.]MBN8764000.1 hypothetical protein [Thiobacillus sp.]